MEAELMNVWLTHRQGLNNPKAVARTLPPNNDGRPIPILNWKDMAIHKIFMKITRECNRHKKDNSVDIAGYAWCLEEAEIEAKRRIGE